MDEEVNMNEDFERMREDQIKTYREIIEMNRYYMDKAKKEIDQYEKLREELIQNRPDMAIQ